MVCPKCGKQYNENARFCTKCGAELLSSEPETPAKTASLDGKRAFQITLIAAICGVTAVILGLFAWQRVNDNRLQSYLTAGYAFMEDGDYEEAVAAFQSALQIDPGSEGTYENLARAYTALGYPDLAAAARRGDRNTLMASWDEVNGIVPASGQSTQVAQSTSPSSGTSSASNTSPTSQNPSGSASSSSSSGSSNSNSSQGGSTGSGSAVKVEEEVVDEQAVQDLLQLLSVPAIDLIEETGNEEAVYTVAALSYIQDAGDDLYDTDITYYFLDGQMYEVNESSGEDQDYVVSMLSTSHNDAARMVSKTREVPDEETAKKPENEDGEITEIPEEESDGPSVEELINLGDGPYVLLESSAEYERHLDDLYGGSYSLANFVEYESSLGTVIRTDEEGQFYLKVIENSQPVEVELEEIQQEEDGTFTVVAQYFADSGNSEGQMMCRIAPDQTAAYGYVLVPGTVE